jgi:GST-like protein
MIQLYSWGTPNGKKASIMLEEVGLPYEVHAVNIGQGDQFKPQYLAINPNNKIPAIVDTDGPGGKPFYAFRIRCDFDVSRGKVRQALAGGYAPALHGDPVADVSDGRRRADVRPG